jgi:hypothetical protein
MSATRSNLTQIIEEEFSKLLSKMSITCVSLTEKEQLKDDYPLIVLCPIYSRPESDIEFVLKHLKEFPCQLYFFIFKLFEEIQYCISREITETHCINQICVKGFLFLFASKHFIV